MTRPKRHRQAQILEQGTIMVSNRIDEPSAMLAPNASPANRLDLKFRSDIGNKTFREYFRQLLKKLISEEESFSGKRPFGNSGWFYDLAGGLIKHKLLAGTTDDFDTAKAEKIIQSMIDEMCAGSPAGPAKATTPVSR